MKRYSEAFKRQAVRDIESPDLSAAVVLRKYSGIDASTLRRWIRRLGSGGQADGAAAPEPSAPGRLERPGTELRLARRALAEAQEALALDQAYLAEACGQMNETVAGFKKKLAGRRPTGRWQPGRP